MAHAAKKPRSGAAKLTFASGRFRVEGPLGLPTVLMDKRAFAGRHFARHRPVSHDELRWVMLYVPEPYTSLPVPDRRKWSLKKVRDCAFA